MTTVNAVSDCEVYKVHNKHHDYWYITINRQTGMVCVINGDYSGLYFWPKDYRGEPDLIKFLADCHKSYLCGKLFNDRYKKYDHEETIKEIKRYIIENRKGTYYTKEKARDLWDSLDWCETAEDIYRDININEVYEFFVYKNPYLIENFYEDIWKPFIDKLQNKESPF